MTSANKVKGDDSLDDLERRLTARLVPMPNGCLEFAPAQASGGYGQISYRGRVIGAHVASWMVRHVAPVPDGIHVLHSCDNPPCCNPAHLRAGTPRDNVQDMHERGRARKASGERSAQARLTAAQVAEIRARHVPGRAAGHGVSTGNTKQLAVEFGVTPQYVGELARGKWRKHG